MDLIVTTTLELVAQFRETAIKLRVNVIMSVRMNGHIPNAMQENMFFSSVFKKNILKNLIRSYRHVRNIYRMFAW